MATVASVVALATEDPVRAETSAWARFSTARDETEFCSAWLAIVCSQIERVNAGLLLLRPETDGSFAPTAMWPDASRDLKHLGGAAERALGERRGVVTGPDNASLPDRDQPAHIGYPIEVSGELKGVVVLELAPGPEAALQRALRLLHWGSVWLVDRFRQRAVTRLGVAMEIVATAMQEHRLGPAAIALVNELSNRLKCDRVSIGFERSGFVDVEAISHTATFDPKMSLVRLITDAMNEALDLDAIVYPPHGDDELGATAHAELARGLNDVAVCSVPLLEASQSFGILTFERSSGEPFSADEIDLCKTVGGVLGPVLALKRENERGVIRRLRDACYEKLQILFGPRHPGVKLLALAAVALVAFLVFATGTYRVTAKTVVEGAVQRAAVAPFDGHIAQSFVRAGDTVRVDQVLCQLDDRDLRLELTRLTAAREQSLRKHRQALTTQDRGAMAVLAAQIAETDAQIALVKDKLARATLRSPFDGVVVSGDLSQLLGTPVEQGKLLFQIAPLDAYRVILEVDERDIASVNLGQDGELTLSGLSDQSLAFAVQQITPVSTQQDGRNYFRVEARLNTLTDRVRPGMEGVGKIAIGDRKLVWIWTHSFVDWLRSWAWKQLP